MKTQLHKAIGLLLLWVSGMIALALGFLWHFIPSVILISMVSSCFAGLSWALFQGLFGFKAHWLMWTIVLYIVAHGWDKKVEKKINEINEINDQEKKDE